MNANARYNLLRVLVALISALVALLVVIPLVYDWAGVRTNLEEFIAPTQLAEMHRKTRVAREATPTAEFVTRAPAPTQVPQTPAPPLPTVAALNGVPIQRLIFLSDATRAHVRDIFAQGQTLGRNPRAFSKVGDSTMVYPPFLAVFDRQTFRLGKFAYLQPTIDYYAGTFGRTSVAVKKGMHTWSQFDPAWALPELCAPNEGPLACELRLNNPSIALIRLGANDTEFPREFEQNLGAIVKYCLARGIIPVLGTKPDRQEGESNLLNNIVRKTASAYSIPLWDYDLIAGTVPGRGLEPDLIHMQGGGTRDYRSPAALRAGDSLEDLSALMMLDALRRELGVEMASSPQ
jgi:hypothetical protein